MVRKLQIIREIVKGDHNVAAAVVRKLKRKQISALSGTLNYGSIITQKNGHLIDHANWRRFPSLVLVTPFQVIFVQICFYPLNDLSMMFS